MNVAFSVLRSGMCQNISNLRKLDRPRLRPLSFYLGQSSLQRGLLSFRPRQLTYQIAGFQSTMFWLKLINFITFLSSIGRITWILNTFVLMDIFVQSSHLDRHVMFSLHHLHTHHTVTPMTILIINSLDQNLITLTTIGVQKDIAIFRRMSNSEQRERRRTVERRVLQRSKQR